MLAKGYKSLLHVNTLWVAGGSPANDAVPALVVICFVVLGMSSFMLGKCSITKLHVCVSMWGYVHMNPQSAPGARVTGS